MYWRKNIYIALILCLLSGCTTIPIQPLSDKEYAERLVGTWAITMDHNGIYKHGEKTYQSDGTAFGYLTKGKWDSDGVYIEEYGYRFRSKWKVHNGIVVIWNIESNPSKVFDPGTELRDKIIYINDKEAKYMDLDDGHTFVRHRK